MKEYKIYTRYPDESEWEEEGSILAENEEEACEKWAKSEYWDDSEQRECGVKSPGCEDIVSYTVLASYSITYSAGKTEY
jgi:hypothetical protein